MPTRTVVVQARRDDQLSAGAQLPPLVTAATAVLVGALVLIAVAVVLVVLGAAGLGRSTTPMTQT